MLASRGMQVGIACTGGQSSSIRRALFRMGSRFPCVESCFDLLKAMINELARDVDSSPDVLRRPSETW